MDKFEKILDMIDHQEKYTDDEIREILRDEECRKLYQTMQEVDSTLLKHQATEADVDEAWEKFSEERLRHSSSRNISRISSSVYF
ncbi:MAG: hypothetical protein U0K51_09815, partial [Segatella copri]|nr:hypothetical protein [Segatella copri]